MQEKDLFEYAVIRIVPKVEREEFLNAGVVLYCAHQNFLNMLYKIDEKRIGSFCNECDVKIVSENIEAYKQIAVADKNAGPISRLPAAERFRWLTATRSTIVQSSKVHPGFCEDAQQTLEKLFMQLVD